MSNNYRLLITTVSISFLVVFAQFFKGGHHYMIPLLSSLFILGAIYFISTSFENRDKFIGPLNSPVTRLFAIFILWATVCVFFSKYTFASVYNTFEWFGYFVLFLIGWYIPAYTKQVNLTNRILKIFIGGSILALVVSYVFYFISEPTEYVRMFGIYLDHNSFGGYLLFASIILFGTFWASKDKSFEVRAWLAILSVFSFAALVLTFSRGTFAAMIASIIISVFVLRHFSKNKKDIFKIAKNSVLILLSAGLVAFGVFLLRADQLAEKNIEAGIYKIETSENNGLAFRLGYLKSTIRVTKDNWLFGVGLGNYSNEQLKYLDKKEFFSVDPHNIYALVLAETGIVGALIFGLLFVTFVLFVFKNGILKNSFSSTGNIYVPILSVALIGFCVHSASAPNNYYSAIFFIFWMFAGVVVSSLTQVNNNQKIVDLKKEKIFLKTIYSVCIASFIFFSLDFVSEDIMKDGDFYHEKGKTELALQTYQRGIKLNPFEAENHARIGNIYRDLGDYQSAIKKLEKAIEMDPERHVHYSDLSYVYKLMGDIENEKQNLIQSTRKNVTSPIAVYERLATIYLEEKQYDKALEVLDYVENVFGRYVILSYSFGDPFRPEMTDALERMKTMRSEIPTAE